MSAEIKRATGLLILDVVNSNPNGDPDRESDPRQRPDRHGEITPVSFKRKPRDLVEDKEGGIWKALSKELSLDKSKFGILESRETKREDVVSLLKGDGAKFLDAFWDARIFGTTFLESGKEDKSSSYMKGLNKEEQEQVKKNAIRTGVVQFGLGISVAPIEIDRFTLTKKSGAQEGKDRGMAPHAYRVVQHGIYCMPFFVNANLAHKTKCSTEDIELLKRLIPLAYSQTRSLPRPQVELIHGWYIEHKNILGSCSDYALLDALKPRKKEAPDKASLSRDEYHIPDGLPEDLKSKVATCVDLAANYG